MKPVVLIKLGGSALGEAAVLESLAALIEDQRKENFDVVLVHGGGPAINQELTARGIQWSFIRGQRQTTPAMLEVIDEVLARKLNPEIVSVLKHHGLNAQGLSGAQNHILICEASDHELMLVGRVMDVDTSSIKKIFAKDSDAVPVIAPVGINGSEQKFNVNADWAAAKIAIALNAQKLIFLTDQDGILDKNKELVRLADPRILHQMIKEDVIQGGMRTKVLAMLTALNFGVREVRVLRATAGKAMSVADKASAPIGTTLIHDLGDIRQKEGTHERSR